MVEIIIRKIPPVSVVSSDNLWAEFGQLKIADSTRKQYVKANELSSRKLREFLSVYLQWLCEPRDDLGQWETSITHAIDLTDSVSYALVGKRAHKLPKLNPKLITVGERASDFKIVRTICK
jgi:hypothetical protein